MYRAEPKKMKTALLIVLIMTLCLWIGDNNFINTLTTMVLVFIVVLNYIDGKDVNRNEIVIKNRFNFDLTLNAIKNYATTIVVCYVLKFILNKIDLDILNYTIIFFLLFYHLIENYGKVKEIYLKIKSKLM